MNKHRKPLKAFSHSLVPQEEVKAVIDELKDAPDRAAAVQLGAYVDSMLTHTLTNLIRTDVPEAMKARILRSTFKEKNDALFVLKITDERTYQNLEIIREIRNAFAHSARLITFETPEVVEAVEALEDDGKGLNSEGNEHLSSARAKFTSCCFRSILTVMFRNIGKKMDMIGQVMEALTPYLNENLRPHAERVARSVEALKNFRL
jgi:hypothetical protein